ncbi:hypothetical protein [Bradyrhizobium japonicum]|uniref:hypothetical protein n=1 Tax=Bradyrhizobium japonicum TaxID=375 RepID=UPI0028A1B0B8|nr:hypothetical protein [Bradyrhizobium japonicum]
MMDRRWGLYRGIDQMINRCFSDFMGIELMQGDNATTHLAPRGSLIQRKTLGWRSANFLRNRRGYQMALRNWYVVLAISAGAMTSAIAQSDFQPSPNAKQDAPRLIEIMNAAQVQHLKLWFAGKSKNWDLAAFELRQLTDSLAQAAIFYPGIPVSNVTTMKEPLLSVADAISAGDSRRFAGSMRALTDGCNACHTSMERGFIAIGVPTDQPPPANQIFAPIGRGAKK